MALKFRFPFCRTAWRFASKAVAPVEPATATGRVVQFARPQISRRLRTMLVACLWVPGLCVFHALAFAQSKPAGLVLSRTARSWEFLSAVGTRAGLFGKESGEFEAWVYPLKILRDFHLQFHVNGRVLPADSLGRTIEVHPESCSILYSGDSFQVRETWFVPVHEAGAVIVLEVETADPLEIEAAFQADFQLEWPGALGGTFLNWDPAPRAFVLGEEQHRFAALVGSPSAEFLQQQYATNYSSSAENSISLGPSNKGRSTKMIVVAASVKGRQEAEDTYHRLLSGYSNLLASSASYYEKYLRQTVSLRLPDSQLQQAYDWARISTVQGMVANSYLGTGLVAGYRTSERDQRPGFAWFFGRDALWTSLALDAAGDFGNTRAALDFLSHFQRADGKMPHEISQVATLVPWFTGYPYAYASADATPLYVIAADEYVRESGDVAFAKEKWESLWKAYQFLRSTYGEQGLPQNLGIGHGWVEGGPLLPVQTEFYQSALGAEALSALADLARGVARDDVARQLDEQFAQQKQLLETEFWSDEKSLYSFALDQKGQEIPTASVLATVPMWFGLLNQDHAQTMISLLAAPEHQADWGMRIISSQDARYNPGGYHFGSVWPLFTGWAAVGEYRYHRALPAYLNLRANSLLALDGALGHVTEVLSGDYYQPLSGSSPHQIWSSAMVVSSLLRGMLGLETDASAHRLRFAPHIPANWNEVEIENVRVGDVDVNLKYSRTNDGETLEVECNGGDCALEFAPAFSLRAQIKGAELNGHPVAVRVERNNEDQHAVVRFTVHGGPNTLRIHLRNDFGIAISSRLPALGAQSEGLRVLSETWGANQEDLKLELAGVPGKAYELTLRDSAEVASMEADSRIEAEREGDALRIRFSGTDSATYVRGLVTLHFR